MQREAGSRRERSGTGLADAAVWLVLLAGSFSILLVIEARPVADVTTNFTSIALSWGELAAGLVALAWLLARAVGRGSITPWPVFVAVPVAALLAAAWLVAPLSSDPSLAAWNTGRLTLAVVVGLAVADLGRVDRLLPALLGVVAVHGFVGLAQVAGQRSLGLGWLGERHLAPGVADASVLSAADGSQLLRAYGLAGSPNIAGGILALSLVLLVAVEQRGRLARLGSLAGWLAGVAALIATFSRGAWLAAAGGMVLLGVLLARAADWAAIRRAATLLAIALIVAIPLAIAYAPFLAARTTGVASTPNEVRSIDERVGLAGQTLAVLAARPLTGTGVGLLPIEIAAAFPDSPWGRAPAHLVPLAVTAEVGVIGGAAALVLLLAPFGAVARHRRPTTELAVATAALAVVAGVGLVDYYPWSSPVGRLWAWAMLGLWVGAWQRARIVA